jgi:Ca2+-binding RTX toxin-like protein
MIRGRRRPIRRRRSAIVTTNPELLDARVMPAVSALFAPVAGLLIVNGDAANNTITVSRDVAGDILVNGGIIAINGGTPTAANTRQIEVFGGSGNDSLSLDETNGALPGSILVGGSGDDTLIGGSGADILVGQSGNDTLLGKGGNDLLSGGDGNDILTGGAGTDRVFGESGNDLMIWNPGDGTDLNEGGTGIDTVQVNGGNGAESFTVTPNGSRLRFDRTSPAPFTIDIGTSENLVVNMNGGDDNFTASNGLVGHIALTVDGGPGNDTITGGDGNDTLLGGDGNDVINGGRGNDVVRMGAGDDTFVWNPGDGSDTVDGQTGFDTMLFNGANVNENITVSASGQHVQFLRDVGNVAMDLIRVESIDFNALGGADTITVNDLSGTDVTEVNLDLSGSNGNGDGQVDTVIVKGTEGDDGIVVIGDASGTSVLGLAAAVNITGAESANDVLTIEALAGDDLVDASSVATGAIQFTADGGDGDDVLIGGAGDDTLLGGSGDDFLFGGPGLDILDGGPGDNTVIQD